MSSTSNIIYDKDGNIDLYAMIPDFKLLSDALDNNQSWYDILYPPTPYAYSVGQKRKMPTSYPDYTPLSKKARIEY